MADDNTTINPGSDSNFSAGNDLLNDVGSNILTHAFQGNIAVPGAPFVGTKALSNNYSTFRYSSAAGNSNMLFDTKGVKGVTPIESRNPSAAKIITWSQESAVTGTFGSTPYSLADFLYCKYYGLIPNNSLITLRRYPLPMFDNLTTPDGNKIPPLAQAVTWMGEETGNKISDILKFTVGINWEEVKSEVQNIDGNEQHFDKGAVSKLPLGEQVGKLQGFLNPNEYSGLAKSQTDYSKTLYDSGPYSNKVYGPVNAITSTMKRSRGLKFEQEFKLTFQYQLASYANINPKMALLDILSNMLALTYNNAKFWGGAIRYFPSHPLIPFMGDQKKFYSGDVSGYISSVGASFESMGKTFIDAFSGAMQNPLQALQQLASGGLKQWLGKLASNDRPAIISMKSLLTGAPVGEWHLVIGNPMNPIALIGNLICTDTDFEFSDKLGADDFPTEMKVTVTLKHGRPRDAGDIQSMYNLGNGRLYYGIKDSDFSSTHNSNIDTSGTKGNVENTDKKKGSKSKVENHTEMANKVDAFAHKVIDDVGKSMWANKFTSSESDLTNRWRQDHSSN